MRGCIGGLVVALALAASSAASANAQEAVWSDPDSFLRFDLKGSGWSRRAEQEQASNANLVLADKADPDEPSRICNLQRGPYPSQQKGDQAGANAIVRKGWQDTQAKADPALRSSILLIERGGVDMIESEAKEHGETSGLDMLRVQRDFIISVDGALHGVRFSCVAYPDAPGEPRVDLRRFMNRLNVDPSMAKGG